MRIIKEVTVNYTAATGEQVIARRSLGRGLFDDKITSIRIRWAGGAGGTFRIYATKEDGTLSTTHIPQQRIIDVQVSYLKQEKK